MPWIIDALHFLDTGTPCVRVFLADTKGSTPRECGASMVVTLSELSGTIGGGTLEFEAIAEARAILQGTHAWALQLKPQALGPGLGQCCGGHVTVGFMPFEPADAGSLNRASRLKSGEHLILGTSQDNRMVIADDDTLNQQFSKMPQGKRKRLWASGGLLTLPAEKIWVEPPSRTTSPHLVLFGAGHVGRELASILSRSDYSIDWVDARADQFPFTFPQKTTAHALANPVSFASVLPPDCDVLIMTHDHHLDLMLCDAALRDGGFRFLGLIGSESKSVRFRKRLTELGHVPDQIDRLICPIGLPGYKVKKPIDVAVLVAAQLLTL